jgi:hypothetical protein
MKKTITIAAYNRPENLAALLASLRDQLLPLDGYKLIVRVDAGGDHFGEVLALTQGIDFVEREVTHSRRNQGTVKTTHWTMERAFEHERADFNIYLEDDLLLAPDALNLAEWYMANAERIRRTEGVKDVGGFCLCNLQCGEDAERVFLSRAFVGWGFVMSRSQWVMYAAPAWCEPEKLWGSAMMWDKSVANFIRVHPGTYNVFPEVSRVTNTGKVGVHMTPARHATLLAGLRLSAERRACEFRLDPELLGPELEPVG